MSEELKKLAAAMRDMSDMVRDHHWQAAKAIEELGALKSKKAEPGEKLGADGLEVVAWQHWGDQTKLLCALGKDRGLPGGYTDEFTHPLCRLADAQRLLSQLREELSQRDAEVERLERKSANCALALKVQTENYGRASERIAALESQQAASVDAAAERNAMQRQRDDVKKLLVRECDDADELVRLLGLDPESVRTDGGFLNLDKVRELQAYCAGGEREAFEAFDYANRCFRLRREGDRYVYATTERELLAFRAGAEWQRAALSPAGGGVEMPTSAELLALSQECEKMKGGRGMHYLNYAREVLRRWGSKPQANSQEGSK